MTYVATYDDTDANRLLLDVDVRVSGGKNANDVLQTPATFPDVFVVVRVLADGSRWS